MHKVEVKLYTKHPNLDTKQDWGLTKKQFKAKFSTYTVKKSTKDKSYNNYLHSERWKKKRYKVLKRDNFQCANCHSKYILQIHHLTYKNIFREPLCDLIALCKDCHTKHHDGLPIHINGRQITHLIPRDSKSVGSPSISWKSKSSRTKSRKHRKPKPQLIISNPPLKYGESKLKDKWLAQKGIEC